MVSAFGLLVGMAVTGKAAEPTPQGTAQAFQLPPLPYAQDALEPYISARTMSFHYGKHHQAYVDNLNKLVAGTPLARTAAGEDCPGNRGRGGQGRHLQQRGPGLEPHLLLAKHETGRRRQAHRAPAGADREVLRRVSTSSRRPSWPRPSRSSAAAGSGLCRRATR